MRESELQRKIRADLKKRFPGCKPIKIHGNQFMEPGIPDINCCVPPLGRTIVIETKILDNKPTKIQLLRLKEYKDAGAISFWCNSFEDYLNKINEHMKHFN